MFINIKLAFDAEILLRDNKKDDFHIIKIINHLFLLIEGKYENTKTKGLFVFSFLFHQFMQEERV